MKVTKYVHSCLLVETESKTVLIDPGRYSFDSHLLSPSKLDKLDYIVITHEHGDHYYLPFLQALVQRLPHTPIVTNNDLALKIKAEGVKSQILTGSEEGMVLFEAEHEPIAFNRPVPLNMGVHIDDQFTHPGDALYIEHTRNILALPVSAPWISTKESLERVAELKPRVVIPVHDWHWHKEARQEQYDMATSLLLPHGIKFIPLENAVPTEI
jgi:L-ascorbate metabolism protein UlaG (beta-lactamase superfamily)